MYANTIKSLPPQRIGKLQP